MPIKIEAPVKMQWMDDGYYEIESIDDDSGYIGSVLREELEQQDVVWKASRCWSNVPADFKHPATTEHPNRAEAIEAIYRDFSNWRQEQDIVPSQWEQGH